MMGTFTLAQSKNNVSIFIYPNGDLAGCIDFTPVGDSDNYKCIDEIKNIPDGDTTHVSWNDVNSGIDMYELPNDTDFTGTINYVQVFARAKAHQFSQDPSGVFKILCSPNSLCGTIFKSDNRNLGTSYQTYTSVWTLNPSTATDWTLNDIRNLSIGIEASSPTRSGVIGEDTYIGNAAGSANENNYWSSTFPPQSGAGTPNNFHYVKALTVNGINCTSLHSRWLDLYNIPNHKTEPINNYAKVTVWAYCGNSANYANPLDPKNTIQLACKSGGTIYYGTETEVSESNTWYSKEWTINPAGGSWNDASIDNLEIGIRLYRRDNGANSTSPECMLLHAKVEYSLDINPEIRTTQCFAKINYTPPSDSCTLNKPEKISVNHSENIKMLNFWDGTRDVYGLNRSGKSMILTGSEYQSDTCDKLCPCEHIACVRAMGKDGSTIAISGLRSLFNGSYKIRSFGWKHMSECPEHYEWILELEDMN